MDEISSSTPNPLQFLADEADRLRPVAESTEADELRTEGEKYRDAATAKRASSHNADIGDELHRASDLLCRADSLDSQRASARARLAEIEGLLSADDDCREAVAAHRRALETLTAATLRRDRIRTVLDEIEAELTTLQTARADELARASADSVRARLDGRPRPEPPADRTADRRASLEAERDQAGSELATAETAVSIADRAVTEPRTIYFEARFRLAQARYCWALAAFVPYLADLRAAADLAGRYVPRFDWSPADDEIEAAAAAIRAELDAGTVG